MSVQVYSGDITKCQGYRLRSFQQEGHRAIGHLELIGKPENAYGIDVTDLTLEVEGLGEGILRVHIFDTKEQHYQVPSELRYGNAERGESDLHHFHYQEEPFAFWIERENEIIFDTRPSKIPVHDTPLTKNDYPVRDSTLPAYPLVFSDQYLQIATALPKDANIYGLGDGMFTSGFRHDPDHTVQAFWNTDPAGNPTDRNLYGAHPFYLEMRDGKAHGVYLRNSHGLDAILRTGVAEFRCLGGTLDLTFMAGPTPTHVQWQYASVVGHPAQMPYWAFGFHLCSLSHETLAQTEAVVKKMRDANIPLEVQWNDYWYMDRKRNFTRGEDFKDFPRFVKDLHARHQHYVPILDAGMTVTDPKRDPYPAYTDGEERGLYLKGDGGGNYEGTVWGGSTVWPDWTHQDTPGWWKKWITFWREKMNWDGLWLDMNEPANLPQATERNLRGKAVITVNGKKYVDVGENLWDVPPYAIHNGWRTLEGYTVAPSAKTADGWRHYHQHNLYPIQESRLTREVMEEMKPDERPFILSRGTFPGQGALTAHWLGDNRSDWESLRFAVQGCLQFQLFQIPMVGADVGGFGGDATEELVNRWMQMGAFLPFYRNHNAGKPQEPFLCASVAEASRKAINIRYRMLPYWENLFIIANQSGTPPMRPLFFEFPNDPELLKVDQQWMVGNALLVAPCLHQGATSVSLKGALPEGWVWRDWYTHKTLTNDTLDAPLGHIPLLLRGRNVIVLHTESRYTLKETREMSYELIATLQDGVAGATMYFDDGISINGPKAKLNVRIMGGKINLGLSGEYKIPQPLARITVLGVSDQPSKVEMEGKALKYEYIAEVEELRIEVGMSLDTMEISYS